MNRNKLSRVWKRLSSRRSGLIFPKNHGFQQKKGVDHEPVAQRHDTCYTGLADAGTLARILKHLGFGEQEVRP